MKDTGLEFTMRFYGVPVYVDENTPLRTTKRRYWDDYEFVEVESDALCMMRDGAVFVHPQRWEHFDAMIKTGASINDEPVVTDWG